MEHFGEVENRAGRKPTIHLRPIQYRRGEQVIAVAPFHDSCLLGAPVALRRSIIEATNLAYLGQFGVNDPPTHFRLMDAKTLRPAPVPADLITSEYSGLLWMFREALGELVTEGLRLRHRADGSTFYIDVIKTPVCFSSAGWVRAHESTHAELKHHLPLNTMKELPRREEHLIAAQKNLFYSLGKNGVKFWNTYGKVIAYAPGVVTSEEVVAAVVGMMDVVRIERYAPEVSPRELDERIKNVTFSFLSYLNTMQKFILKMNSPNLDPAAIPWLVSMKTNPHDLRNQLWAVASDIVDRYGSDTEFYAALRGFVKRVRSKSMYR